MLSPVKIWRNQKKVRRLLNLEGRIVSFTKVHIPSAGFESQAPYVVAIVRLNERISYTAQLIDFEEKHLRVGQKVKTVLRRTREAGEEGIIPYGIKFKPL